MGARSLNRWPVGEEIRYQEGEIHPLVAALPYYGIVPKEPLAHLDFRIEIAERCAVDLDFREMIRQWCAEDPLFFANTFVYIVEARAGEQVSGAIPLNTWCHQDPWLAALSKYSGIRDVKGDKSRAQGESWLLVVDFVREFLFLKDNFQGLVSLDENTADNPDNPDSLGWKIDFIHENLPEWMKVPGLELGGKNRKVSDHTWRNPAKNNYIQAFAATGTVAKGGRRRRFGFDEAAFMLLAADAIENLRAVTNCRCVFSTPNGTGNYFYELMHRRDSWLTITLDWEDNPAQNQGKYTSQNGKLVIIDTEYEFPVDYPFVLDGITRSPWFDGECERAGNNMAEINRELRRDYGGSKTRPFPETALSTALKYCRTPDHQGTLRFERSDPSDIDSMKWREEEGGPLKLWFHPDGEGLPPQGIYVVNADISAGTGSSTSSNSVIEVFNSVGEQVAEFACNRTPPTKLARIFVALCYWFGRGKPTSYANFEKTGPLGTQFSGALRRLQYPHVYHMIDRTKRGAKRSNNPGWHTSKTANTLEPLVNALCDEQIVIRSFDLARECGEYEFAQGDWTHPGAKSAKDAADQGFNHGDRAVAAGIAVISLIDRHMLPDPKPKRVSEDRLSDAPHNSIAGRLRQQQERRREREDAASCVW